MPCAKASLPSLGRGAVRLLRMRGSHVFAALAGLSVCMRVSVCVWRGRAAFCTTITRSYRRTEPWSVGNLGSHFTAKSKGGRTAGLQHRPRLSPTVWPACSCWIVKLAGTVCLQDVVASCGQLSTSLQVGVSSGLFGCRHCPWVWSVSILWWGNPFWCFSWDCHLGIR